MVAIHKAIAFLCSLRHVLAFAEKSGETEESTNIADYQADDHYSPSDLLDKLREEYRRICPKKYNYRTSHLDRNSTLFHKYFTSYTLTDDEITRYTEESRKDGYLIELEYDDDTEHEGTQIRKKEMLLFPFEEIEEYGRTEFDLPFGRIRELDEVNEISNTNTTNVNNTNTSINHAYKQLENYAYSTKNAEALIMVADINTLGLYNILDVNLGINAYLEVINLEDVDTMYESHAHFMLGVIYSTGLFRKAEKDAAKGMIHYQIAADMGNIQAQMTLAHKFMFGVNVVENMDHAIYYFSLVKEKIEEKVNPYKVKVEKTPAKLVDELIFNINFDKFDVSWTDIAGGLYDSSTQAIDTIRYFEKFEAYEGIRNQDTPTADHDDYDAGDDATLDGYSVLYFFTQKYYTGDYLQSRNYKMAFQYADICVRNGIEEPGVKEIFHRADKNEPSTFESNFNFMNTEFAIHLDAGDEINPLREFVGRCSQYLGHMYLRGEGVDVNYTKAYEYITTGRKLSSHHVFINDLAIMQYYGLGIPQEKEEAVAMFDKSLRFASSRYYKAMSIIDDLDAKTSPEAPDIISNDAYTMLHTSSPYNSMAKRAMMSIFENNRYDIPNKNMAGTYNSYVKLFNDMFFDFKIPFYSFINANLNDESSTETWTSLAGLAIASELGYADAQASLGTILYPTLGDFKSKKYRENALLYQDVYTAKRFEEAISYMELSAKHYNRDSIIFLGDMYYNGLYSCPKEQIKDDPLYNRPIWQYMLPLSSADDMDNGWLISTITHLLDVIEKHLLPSINHLKNTFSTFWTSTIEVKSVSGEHQRAIIPRDFSKAIAYYHDAASLGSHLASFNVGWAYEYGIGVTQDLHLAKRYYDLSLERSSDGYLPVKYAVFRVRMKAFIWSLLGCDGRGIREMNQERKTWKQRMMMIIGWISNPDE